MFDANAATAQEVFDYVIGQLVCQGGRSVSASGTDCRYRGSDGRKCAVGFLIPDELYVWRMEGDSISGLCGHFPDLCAKSGIKKHNDILNGLQHMHDSLSTWQNQDSFSHKTRRIADLYNLTVPEIAYTYQPKAKE
jgi:hypothetical protein